MSQKNYSTLITAALQRSQNHVRGLARLLGTNQTTIARKIRELYRENVVDYREEGRNKVFFIRKTLEAKQYSCLAENYRLLETVKRYPRLRRIIEQIRKNEKIGVAILFGSYAKWSATEESDIDLYIDTADRKIKDVVEMIDSKISAKIGRYDRSSLLIREIEKDHVIIKGTEAYYEKNSLFGEAEQREEASYGRAKQRNL
jgi:predicted nucleotidyltransferase